jgi:dTMP kinase
VNKGKFIVFEGLDGSGKSTQIQMLSKRLQDLGVGLKVYTTAEPTEGPIGTLIRQMLSGKMQTDQRALACLFAADRTDHLVNKSYGIKNKVDSGELVLCDRYYFSSYAYHAGAYHAGTYHADAHHTATYHAGDMDMEWLITLNLPNAEIMRPDLTIFIDVSPEKCFDRIKAGRWNVEIFEHLDILKQVRENYFKAFDILKNKEKVIIIDGNDDVNTLGDKILQVIQDKFIV